MKRLVGIQFKQASRVYFFECGESPELVAGTEVVVETEFGLGLGKVACTPKDVEDKDAPPKLKRIVRLADESDIERLRKNKERQKHAFDLCVKLIKQKKLDMKLVGVEYLYDASKAIFFFSAEQRVDFRDLVRDLARSLHTRIEMKQIGVRDESKFVGGIGCCGRQICCSTFLREFHTVSVKMAKEQNLAMNPSKISGLCGRLMCCLAFEHPFYEEACKKMPKKGKTIDTPDGPARIVDINVIKKLVTISTESGGTITVPLDKLTQPKSPSAPQPKSVDIPPPGVTRLEGKSDSEERKTGGKHRPRRRRRDRKGSKSDNDGNA